MDKDDTNTDLERGLANLRPSTTTSTTQLSNPMEAIQVLIQTMEESRKIERLAMEERHREAEERRTREMEVKEESRRAEYKAIGEQHRRELHEMLQMQLKLQQEHQNEVWHRQKDLDDSRRDRDRKRKLADKIAPWTDKDQPASYLRKFEDTLSTAGISKDEWASLLVPLLTGIVSTAYTTSVSEEAKVDYDLLKMALLKALGRSKEACEREFWSFRRKDGDATTYIIRELLSMAETFMENCNTIKEAAQTVATGKFLSLYSLEDANHVRARKPETFLDVANFMTERQAMKNQFRDRRPPYTKPWSRPGDWSRNPRDTDSPPGDWRSHCDVNKESKEGHHNPQLGESMSVVNNPFYGSSQGKPQDRSGDRVNFVPTCFGCGKKGHKRPDCPLKQKVGWVNNSGDESEVARKKKPSERSESVIAAILQPGLYVEGRIGQRACSMRIDTGADRTVVDANLVEETEYLGRSVTLEGFNGFNVSQPLAKVWIEVGKHRLHHIVAVVDNAPEKILLGMDTGIMRYLLELEVQQMHAKEELKLANSKVHELTLITRDQAACQAAEEQVDTELSAESGAMPFQFSDEMFGDEEAGEVDIQATKDGEPIDIPIPELQEEASDKLRLSSQQEEDPTLARIRQLAKDGKDGYSWKDKVLVHRMDDTMSERVVVPEKRRKGILRWHTPTN